MHEYYVRNLILEIKWETFLHVIRVGECPLTSATWIKGRCIRTAFR